MYIAEAPKPTSRFPSNQLPPLHLDGLAEYLRDFNRAHAKIRAHIVTSDRSRRLSCPLLLRFSIRDALNVFLTVDETEEKALVVENATAFSSREQVILALISSEFHPLICALSETTALAIRLRRLPEANPASHQDDPVRPACFPPDYHGPYLVSLCKTLIYSPIHIRRSSLHTTTCSRRSAHGSRADGYSPRKRTYPRSLASGQRMPVPGLQKA